ncbi:uncharacterized protein LOC141690607 [Apium graveolens]|uniref:uncharacterized protein LOC141690607 n=1 Tax=Apium graveolens TaxID=4045 RepID=UPI003D7B712B
MSLLSWNYRGLDKPWTIHFLKELTQQLKPMDAQGHSGGLALFWKNEGGCEVKGGKREKRQESWNLLRELANKSDLPWCIIGDFNDMMSTDEKRGGRPHPFNLLQGFIEVVNECGLVDLGFVGEKYTWERSRGKLNWIQERLDKGLANRAWSDLFPQEEVQVMEMATSDHLPLYLHLHKKVFQPNGRRFRFKNSWLREKECEIVINNGWNEALASEIMENIKLCGLKLQEWGGGLANEYKQQGRVFRAKLRKLRSHRDSLGINMYNEVRWQYMNLLEKQEVYWRQRAKSFWLREGDNNTGFFHKFASGWRKTNNLERIQDGNGERKETTQLSDRELVSQVTTRENEELIAEVIMEEAKVAVFSMHPDKSPRPDGLNPIEIVSDRHSAFIEGRLLTDNAMLAFEINHYLKRKTQGKNGLAELKIDISKTYDRLEWDFILNMMKKFGFHDIWVDRIMRFIQSVSYSFLHKDGEFGNISPQRRLCQGDPISPYIYIMCAEGLSSIIRRNEDVGLLHGCTVAREAPIISHLLFADDCYFLFRANAAEAGVMKRILNRYE